MAMIDRSEMGEFANNYFTTLFKSDLKVVS